MKFNFKEILYKYKEDINENRWSYIIEDLNIVLKRDYSNARFSFFSQFYSLLFQAGIDILPFLKYIPSYMFYNSNVSNLVIPENIENIESGAIQGGSIEKIDLSKTNIKELSRNSIDNIPTLKEIHLPTTITDIHDYYIHDCNNMRTIIYEGTKDEWKRIRKSDYWIYNKYLTILVKCTDGDIKEKRS